MIFNSIFDNIYVLNLKESADRRAHIETEFKRVDILKYQFFEGTPHDSTEVINITKSGLVKRFPNCFRCDQKRCNCENNYLTPFQIGNWCSFLNIFNDIIKNDYKFVLICEDDIVFSHQYKRIINKLLSKESFRINNINMDKPVLIRMGTAFNPDNHNSNAEPRFLKNFSLCNPCFAINKEMAITYLKYLKIIDYHSDVYFHQKIPKNVPGIQYFTMYPYPIYELSFVKGMQKFNSLVRPPNQIRRIEYVDNLYLSSNILLNICLNTMNNILPIINKYYFENKTLYADNKYDDVRIIYKNILDGQTLLYSKISNIDFTDKDKMLDNAILFYKFYSKLINIEGIKIIDINENKDYDKYIKYIKIKKQLLKDIHISEEDIIKYFIPFTTINSISHI